MKRFGQIIGLSKENFKRYAEYHASIWPEINSMITECNIRNYTIFYKDELLFAYFEYIGDDYEGDMRKMADDPKTQEWWAIMKPLQSPLDTRKEGEWWADMEEVYHLD